MYIFNVIHQYLDFSESTKKYNYWIKEKEKTIY